MTALLTLLRDREAEFREHQAFTMSVEDLVFSGEGISIGATRLDVQHLRTLKSGLVIHLYNVVESVMSQIRMLVGHAIGSVPPKAWSAKARREWLREHGVARIGAGDPERRLDQMDKFSLVLFSEEPLGQVQRLRKPLRSWDDENIGLFAWRLGVELPIGDDMRRKLGKWDTLGEKTPMWFIADRRNALGHGLKTFQEGAFELTLALIRAIADVTFEFMELVVDSFQGYVDRKQFVAVP